jgi:hypothetical protein
MAAFGLLFYRGQSGGKSFESSDTSYAKHEKMVRFGDAHPNATNSQSTQYEYKPTVNSQFTEYGPKPTNSQFSQSDRPNLCNSGAQSEPNLCSVQSQPDMPNCQPAAQHSVSYIYGLNIF